MLVWSFFIPYSLREFGESEEENDNRAGPKRLFVQLRFLLLCTVMDISSRHLTCTSCPDTFSPNSQPSGLVPGPVLVIFRITKICAT